MMIAADGDGPDVGVVVPAQLEVQNVARLVAELSRVIGATGYSVESLFVQDDSTDQTVAIIGELACTDAPHE